MNNNNNVEKEINDYIKRIDDPLQKYLIQNQEKYRKSIYSLEYFYFVTNYISNKGFESVGDEIVLLSLFTKASMDLYGIHYCLKHGLETQAQQIARGLYETYITVELILKDDVKERLKLFHDYQHIQRWNQIEFHKKTDTEFELESLNLKPEYLEYLNKKFEEVKINYHPKSPTHWAWKIFQDKNKNPSLLDICKYLGIEFVKEYVMTYPAASITSHPTQVLTDYFTKYEDGKSFVVSSPKNTKLTDNISGIALRYCGKITIEILEYFKLENYENIVEFIKCFVAENIGFDYDKNIK